MFTFIKSAINNLVTSITNFLVEINNFSNYVTNRYNIERDRDNIENYLSWSLEVNQLETIKLYND